MKLGEAAPFVTVVIGKVYTVVIQRVNDSPKPDLHRVLKSNFRSDRKVRVTLSNAFLASNDTNMVLFYFC